MERHRFNQTQSLEERLAEVAKRLRVEAKLLPPGPTRDEIIRRAREAETGSRISEWLRPPRGLAHQNRTLSGSGNGKGASTATCARPFEAFYMRHDRPHPPTLPRAP
jgi:hypothetical protein